MVRITICDKMGSKIKFIIPALILVFCVVAIGAFAAYTPTNEFRVLPDTLDVNWTDDSDLGFYSANLTITNIAAHGRTIEINVSNSTSSPSFVVKDSTGAYNNESIPIAILTSTDVTLIFNETDLPEGTTYTQTIIISNSTDSSESAFVTVNFNILSANSYILPAQVSINENIGITESITAGFWINNTEDDSFEIIEVNNTGFLMKDGTQNISFNLIVPALPITIPANTPDYKTFTFGIDIANTSNSIGTYSGYLDFNVSLGGKYQIYKLPLEVNLTDVLNVSVSNIQNVTEGVASIIANLTMDVEPRYWNGSIVDGLDETNFTVSLLHAYNAILSEDEPILTVTKVQNEDAYYTIDVSTLPDLLGGNYTISVEVTDKINTGTGSYDNSKFAINETALLIEFYDCGTYCATTGLAVSTAYKCKHNITNYGYKTAENVNISYVAETGITVSSAKNELGDIARLQSNLSNVSVTTGSSAGDKTLTLTGIADGTAKWSGSNIIVLTYNILAPTSPADDDTGTGTGVGTPVTEKVSKLVVVVPTTFEVEQGTSKSLTVTVQNTGSYNVKGISLTADKTWFSSSDKKDIAVLEKEKDFSTTITVPEDVEPITYTVTVAASGIDVINKAVSSSKSFTLKVTPNSETQEQIKANLTAYKSEYDNVLGIYNSSIAAGKNVSNVSETINQLTGLFTQADSFIGEGKYTEAYETLMQIKTLLTQAQDQLAMESGLALQINPEIIAGGIVVVGLLAIIIYFARNKSAIPKIPKMKFKLPTKKASVKSKTYKKSFKPSNDSFADKLKDKFKR
ncbi:MAG: hypothetical protein KJ697_01915 [Nanoarchaeota archaeon]|nr:hypothetical protein [Nanoarchaeota archaeon]